MKTETVVSSETIVHIYQFRLRHISGDNIVTITVIYSKACRTHGYNKKIIRKYFNKKFRFWKKRIILKCMLGKCGPGSSVGIVTDHGLEGPGIESQWGRDIPPVQTGPGAHPASCTMGTGSFQGVKCGRRVLLTTHPLLAPRFWKSRAIPLTPSGPQPGLQRGYFIFMLETYAIIVK
jgi:hypothetical protein